ncbi:LysR family transcriptional regulator [Butyrivibrio sp. AE2005]|uniref:LysR family transcriptional regulator n=1 Tax=Butyrivibrio sp. AE2005 TaxID=1496722 RepID=UPI00047B5A6D|nr:LysR family transcriptional regulator [Butyrivibrio sp. AE2005]
MNQRQLQYFLEVYSQNSITKAANNLFVTPQGLSKTISTLEKELGVQLFKHKSNRILPTAEAARLAIHAKYIIDEYDVITNRLFQEKSTVKTVTIYCSYDVPQLISASFFREFNEAFPNIRINIKEYPDDYALKKVENNEVELAILPGPFNPHKISYTHLCTESFCIVVNKTHPLAEYDSVPFSKIANESLVIKDSSSFTSINQIYTFLGSKNAPSIILETSDVHLIHQMAEDSQIVGISLMYLARKIRSDKIKVIPFDEDWLSKKLFIVHNKNNILSNEALLFEEAITKFFRSGN